LLDMARVPRPGGAKPRGEVRGTGETGVPHRRQRHQGAVAARRLPSPFVRFAGMQRKPYVLFADLLKVIVMVAGAVGLGGGVATAEQEAWLVKDADIRIPVAVAIGEALSRMPPQVYLADLAPVEAKGIVFDRKTKLALKAKGSVTFSLKPEYAWLSLRNRAHVFVDDQKIAPLPDGEDRIFALPCGGNQLRIEAEAYFVGQAGFITRGPMVSRADLCLPGLDPTALVPLVYRMSGEQVGCSVLWAHPSEPMQIVFDCSSGETQYHVYLVDRSKRPPRLDWTPKAGLISVADARMWIGSKAIDMEELKGKFVPKVTNLVSHGKMYLGEGVHPFKLIYFNEGENTFLKFNLPETWVQETEILAGRVKAAALGMTGEAGRAREVLTAVRPDAWPLGEHIGRMDVKQSQQEQLMLMQVKVALKAGKMDVARDVYVKLKEIAPYS